jgi:hypothetical protein
MSYPTYDTDWATSAKGNQWRRLEGVLLVVGRSRNRETYWAMADGNFVSQDFQAIGAAKHAAEALAALTRWR